MRLGLKLIVLGMILLLPKTNVYLSSADISETQPSQRQISSQAAHRDADSAGRFTVSAANTQ
ncbi:hypothetical protein [Bradyrhizobium sp. 5.13L]